VRGGDARKKATAFGGNKDTGVERKV